MVWRAQVPRALTGSPPSPRPRALARRAQVPRALTSRPPPRVGQQPGGAGGATRWVDSHGPGTPLRSCTSRLGRGDRPYPKDLRSIFWAAPHDPEEDFHWTRQISSWTLPGLLGMFGHSFTLRQLCPLLQGPRQRGPKNKAQNQIRLEGWETVKEDARCFLKEEGLPFPRTGPEWRLVYGAMGKVLAARAFLTDTPVYTSGNCMRLSTGTDMRSSHTARRIICSLESATSWTGSCITSEALMDRIGGPGALAEVKVNCNTKQWWVGAVPDAVAPHLPQARLHRRYDQADGP